MLFWSYGFKTIVFGHYSDAFCTSKCGHVCFFVQHNPYTCFSTKCWKTMALLCLRLRNQGHTWPYLPTYGHIWRIFSIILKVQLRYGLTIFSIRYVFFLLNDQKNCPLRDLAIMTQKHGISGFQAREQQSQPRLLGSVIFHRIPWVCAVMEGIQWVARRSSSVWTYVSLSWCLHAFGQSKSSDAMPWAKVSTEFDSPFQGEHSFETSSSSYTKKASVPVAASNAHWWKDHARIQRSLAGIPSV